MSLKSRIQQNRENKSVSFSKENTDCNLLDFFKEHNDLNSMTVYSHNKISGEKNGKSSQLFIAFSSLQQYKDEVERIIRLYGKTDDNPHIIINTKENIRIDIYLQPLALEEPIILFSRQENYNEYLKEKLINNELILFFKECLKQKANIFIAGNASVNKNAIMNIIANLQDSSKRLILCEQNGKINVQKSCALKFSKNILKTPLRLKYDNIFCSDVSNEELINIFKLIISGHNGFITSLSINDNTDIFSSLRNMILLSNMNLFEENADFMTTTSIDIVVFVENTINNQPRIVKVSEKSKNKTLKDIFVWEESTEKLVCTENPSKFINPVNTEKPDCLDELYENNSEQESITLNCDEEIYSKENNFEDIQKPVEIIQTTKKTSSKLEKLKEKIKQFKAEQSKQNAVLTQEINTVENDIQKNKNLNNITIISESEINKDKEPEEEIIQNMNNPILNTEKKEISTQKTDINLLNDKKDFEQEVENIEKNQINIPKNEQSDDIIFQEEQNIIFENVKNDAEINDITFPMNEKIIDFVDENYSGRIDVEQVDLIDSDEINNYSNEGLLASENDDFSDEFSVPQKKIRNILEEDDEDNEDINQTEEVKNLINQIEEDTENKFDIFTEKYTEEFTQEEKYQEPELFEEIKDIDVNNYDVADIPDEDI